MERKVLGRGLDALIPQDGGNFKERVQVLKISQVHASRFQPRLSFSQDKIEELAQSIKEKGIIQPILVRAIDGDNYELIAGERRFRAAKSLNLEEIPAIVRRIADQDALETSIIENIQREELNALDEAKAYQRLAMEFGFTQDTIAQRVGKDKSSISNLLRILNLPSKVQDYLSQNLISFGHAKALLAITDSKKQIELSDKIIKNGLSVRQVEQVGQKKKLRSAGRIQNTDLDVKNLEEKLQHQLGTKVRIAHGKKRGQIQIDYYSLEDLDRVLKLLGVTS